MSPLAEVLIWRMFGNKAAYNYVWTSSSGVLSMSLSYTSSAKLEFNANEESYTWGWPFPRHCEIPWYFPDCSPHVKLDVLCIRGFTMTRYINTHFTYLLTYMWLLTSCIYSQCYQYITNHTYKWEQALADLSCSTLHAFTVYSAISTVHRLQIRPTMHHYRAPPTIPLSYIWVRAGVCS